jgi:preprotein translocase SecF subunit
MLRPIRPIPTTPRIRFIARRFIFFALSGLASIASIVLLALWGLNFGIDFRGGILIEIRGREPVAIGDLRDGLGSLGLGEVALQEFGEATDVLIRLQQQPGGDTAQEAAVRSTRERVAQLLGDDVEFRRVEVVGPQVSSELVEAGSIAVLVSIAAMMVYIWFRFEWQFGVGAVLALVHDVLLTLGLFALLQIEFNLAIVAALLTIIGYSMNDTVVIFDRVRENLRKFKQMPLGELIDLSVNETLSRTLMTGGSTLLALLALYIFGGEVIAGFTLAMIWGVIVGTYSSVYIAAPVLLYTGVRGARPTGEAEAKAPVSTP